MKLRHYLSLFGALMVTHALGEELPVLGKNVPPCCVIKKGEPIAVSDESLYLLGSNWETDRAKQIKLTELGGKPQVVTMFFATCIYACPILVHDMKKIEAALPEGMRGKVGFTMVSFDSARDTVDALSAFRKTHSLPANWTLLRGGQDDVLELAALLGVKFKKEKNGQFAHSNLITVLNTKGEIIFQKAGLNTDPAEITPAIQEALKFNSTR